MLSMTNEAQNPKLGLAIVFKVNKKDQIFCKMCGSLSLIPIYTSKMAGWTCTHQ